MDFCAGASEGRGSVRFETACLGVDVVDLDAQMSKAEMGPRLRWRPQGSGHGPAHELDAEAVLHDVAHALLGASAVNLGEIGDLVAGGECGTGFETQRLGEKLDGGAEVGHRQADVRQDQRHGGTVDGIDMAGDAAR